MTSRSVATAERRHEKTADNSGVEAAIGRYARSDRNRHRKRQCHDGDGETGNGVGLEVRDAVALAEHGDELGHEQLGEGGRSRSCCHVSRVLDALRSASVIRDRRSRQWHLEPPAAAALLAHRSVTDQLDAEDRALDHLCQRVDDPSARCLRSLPLDDRQ